MYICTSRLILRDYQAADWRDLHEIFSDPEVMKDCESVYTQERTKEMLAYFVEEGIAYAVMLADCSKVIGHIIFHQLPGEADGIYEIGWFINRNYWKQGYAFEAANALIRYGFEEMKLHKITAETIDPGKSVGLMKKLGMIHEGTFTSHVKDLDGNWVDLYWYATINPKEV